MERGFCSFSQFLKAAKSFLNFFFYNLYMNSKNVLLFILLIGLVGSAVSYLIFGFAQDFNTLLISRCFAGICGATITTAFAYITDVTTNENRAKGMGMIGAAFGLGFIFGPILTGLFFQATAPLCPFLLLPAFVFSISH
jgi:MFS family permease